MASVDERVAAAIDRMHGGVGPTRCDSRSRGEAFGLEVAEEVVDAGLDVGDVAFMVIVGFGEDLGFEALLVVLECLGYERGPTQAERSHDIGPEAAAYFRRVAWAVFVVLESVRIEAAGPCETHRVGAVDGGLGDLVVEPVLAVVIVHAEQAADPDRGVPLDDPERARDPDVERRADEGVEFGDELEDLDVEIGL